MKVYLIKSKKTGEVIRWEGSLKEFMLLNIHGIKQTDGERRTLANTKDRDTYYKGYKILFFGEEEPKEVADFNEEPQMLGYETPTYRDDKGINKTAYDIKIVEVVEEKPDTYHKDGGYECGHYQWIDDEEVKEEVKEGFDYEGREDFEREIKLHWKVDKPKRNVLFIPDLHCPFDYTRGIKLAERIYEEEGCTEVVFLGDVLDFYSISEYGKSPDFMSQTEELVKTKEHLKAWHDAFPTAKVCTGNHTMRIKKKFDKAGLSSVWMKSFGEMFELDGWDFQLYHEIGKFIATHGMGQNAKSRSKSLHKSVICGHLHSKFEAYYNDGLWAIYGGCMVDIDHRAFEYGKFFTLPKLGFVVVKDIDGEAKIKMIEVKYEKEDEGYEKMHEMW